MRVDNGLRGVVTGLKPWSVYTMMVVGYNSAGLGQQYREVITTLDSSKCVLLCCNYFKDIGLVLY